MTPERVEITEHLELVERVARQTQRRYAEWVEYDDLVGEAAVWWYSKGQKYLPEYLAEEGQVRLRRSLHRWMVRFAERERAHRIGYHPVDQVRYSAREVLSLLRVALDPIGLPQHGFHEGQGPKRKGNLAEGGDMLASLIDVRRALAVLPADDLHLLVLADDLEHDWERISQHTETQPDSARRRHARIAERLARWLNNEEELVA